MILGTFDRQKGYLVYIYFIGRDPYKWEVIIKTDDSNNIAKIYMTKNNDKRKKDTSLSEQRHIW